MAYSTNNSTTVAVTNFGARGNRIVDDTPAFQRAIDSLIPRGGGTIFVPKGDYLTSGYLHVTGHNISIVGEPGLSWIRTAPSGDFKKLNISGASGFTMMGMSIDAGRTSGLAEQYVGTTNIYSAPFFRFDNCYFGHTEGILINMRANTYCGVIENSVFEDFHIGIRGDSNDIPNQPFNRITIRNNTLLDSWGFQPQQDFFGAIKFQNIGGEYNGIVTGRCYGHIIQGNRISGSSEMGIELFGYVSDSIVSNNYIEDVGFGVSIAASSFNIVVDSNVFKKCASYGIELADAMNITASNNIIEGATGNNFIMDAHNTYYVPTSGVCYTQIGIIANGIIRRPNLYNIVGNTINDCASANIKCFVSDGVNIVGNNLSNRARGAAEGFDITSASNVNFSNNQVNQISTGTYFVFVDSNSFSSSGIRIVGNRFRGSVSQWGILYYNNSNTGGYNTVNALVEGNDTSNVNYCFYGMMNASSNPPSSALHRSNFGSPFGSGYYIPDAQIPEAAYGYQTTAIADGFQHYGMSTWLVPSGGITGNGIWLCAWSGYQGGKQNNVRLMLSTDFHYDGLYQDNEIWATMTPYGGGIDTLVASPIVSSSPVISQIKTLAIPNEVRNAIWVKLRPTSTGAFNAPVSIFYSAPQEVTAGQQGFKGYSTYVEPTDTANNAKLVISNPSGGVGTYASTYKFLGGVTLGGSGAVTLNSSRSGVMQLYSPENSNYGGILSFGKRIAPTTIALYDDLVGPTVYGLGIAPNQMRIHVDAPTSRFGFFDGPTGSELVTILGNGNVGIGNPSPDLALDVKGPVRSTLGTIDVRIQAGTIGAAGVGSFSNDALLLLTSGTEKMRISTAGDVGIGVISPGARFHVSGSLRFDGITTSTTAVAGAATLPGNPVGFITINITGGNFKIPYYNL